MARAALIAVVFLLALPGQALAVVGTQIDEVESLTAQPVIAGDEILWPGNYGYCVPSPAYADPDACVQYLARWHKGVVTAGRLFEAPRVNPDRRYGVLPVVRLAASRNHIGYERWVATHGVRFNNVLADELGVLTPGGGDVFVAGCTIGVCPFGEDDYDEGKAGIDVWGHTVATGFGPSGRRGIRVVDLETRTRRVFRDEADYCCPELRLAGRYLATAEVVVRDWRRKRRVMNLSRYLMPVWDLQPDGRLFALVEFKGRPNRIMVSSPRRPRPRAIRKTDASMLIAARNLVAWQKGTSIGVTDLRGRLRASVWIPAYEYYPPRGEVLQLADFDGRCLVWTQTRFERQVSVARIFVAPVAGGGPACD